MTKKTTLLTKGCWPTVAEVGTVDNNILVFVSKKIGKPSGCCQAQQSENSKKSLVQHEQRLFKFNYIFCNLMLVDSSIGLLVYPDSGVLPSVKGARFAIYIV